MTAAVTFTDPWDDIAAEALSRLHTAATVQICLRFSELARADALQAEEALARAQRRAEAARSYLERTTTTLEQAIRLHAMNRR